MYLLQVDFVLIYILFSIFFWIYIFISLKVLGKKMVKAQVYTTFSSTNIQVLSLSHVGIEVGSVSFSGVDRKAKGNN